LAIARGLGIDDHVAERLKRGETVEFDEDGDDAGYATDDDDESDRERVPPDPAKARELAMQRASSFVDEIRSSLEFYTAQSQGARIARVLVTGGGSKLDGFLDLLRQRIPVEVDAGRVYQRAIPQMKLSEAAKNDAEPLLAVAVGLAIPGRNT
jgi:Tfp pilus assembly PilM family ATPase